MYGKKEVMYEELGSRGWQRIGNREASRDGAELMEKCSEESDTKNLTLRVIFARGEMIYAPHASFFLFYFSFFLTDSVPDLISVSDLYVKILTYCTFQRCCFFFFAQFLCEQLAFCWFTPLK